MCGMGFSRAEIQKQIGLLEEVISIWGGGINYFKGFTIEPSHLLYVSFFNFKEGKS